MISQMQNPNLLRQVFVRSSYTEENGGENIEVLEFIENTFPFRHMIFGNHMITTAIQFGNANAI